MYIRNIALIFGLLLALSGIGLIGTWLYGGRTAKVETSLPAEQNYEILIASRAIETGSLLRSEDVAWKTIPKSAIQPGVLIRNNVTDKDYLGGLSRKAVALGQPLLAENIIKQSDRNFLSAVLKQGYRAVSIAVDASQSISGLLKPDDRVDIILIQTFAANEATFAHRVVGETVVQNVRIIAVDQSLNTAKDINLPVSNITNTAEYRIPKTVTLELANQDAEKIMVASELGHFLLAVRPILELPETTTIVQTKPLSVWAADVSPAIEAISNDRSGTTNGPTAPEAAQSSKAGPSQNCQQSVTGSTLECLLRRPPGARQVQPPVQVKVLQPATPQIEALP